jgi:3-hydroxyacyl-CoA dehydrogenase
MVKRGVYSEEEQGLFSRIRPTTRLEDGAAVDLVIEATRKDLISTDHEVVRNCSWNSSRKL